MTRRSRRMARKGDWSPAHLTKLDATIIVSTLCVTQSLRSFDYVVGNDQVTRQPVRGKPPAVSLLSDAFPIWWYGAALGLSVLVLILGATTRKHRVVWLGHGLSMVVYFVLFIGTLIPILSTPYLDGLRGASALLAPVVFHAIFWLRTGPKPLARGEGVVTTEMVQKQGDH